MTQTSGKVVEFLNSIFYPNQLERITAHIRYFLRFLSRTVEFCWRKCLYCGTGQSNKEALLSRSPRNNGRSSRSHRENPPPLRLSKNLTLVERVAKFSREVTRDDQQMEMELREAMTLPDEPMLCLICYCEYILSVDRMLLCVGD